MKKITFFFIIFNIFYVSNAQPDIELVEFGPLFNDPVSIKHAYDSRLFIVEQDGYIQILNADGSVNPAPFLDIDALVVNTGSERGLLGLAFHPDYAANGYFYVNYINNSGNTVISRFSRSMSDPDLADLASEVILLTVTQPYQNHNGGDLAFGPDGYLYIALGDGGSGGDPSNFSQSLNTLLGKILRIDVDSGSPYGIPVDNPFLNDGDANTLAEIWAYGLRNPWKFSIDPIDGDIWIADVGQNIYEEINKVPVSVGGINYGWRCYEGNHVYNDSGCPPSNTMVFPVSEYSHTTTRCSITGGYKYNGSMYPGFNGLYFFADYCSSEIGYLELDNGNWVTTWTEQFIGNNWSTFGEDINGELYIAGVSSDRVYKITDANLSVDEISKAELKIYPNPAQEFVNISLTHVSGFSIEVYDMTGKLVDAFESAQSALEYSIQHFDTGVYFIKATSNNSSITKKMVVN